MAKNDFQYGGWKSYTLQCGTITTLLSSGDHPAMWHMALESWRWIQQVTAPCNVIRGSGMICLWIRPNVRHIGILHLVSISTHHRSRHVILYQSANFYPNRTTLGRRKQELSCHKQIARQLRTQYAEVIYDNPVTLKSRLTITQGHWKRNHWVDHIRLTVRRVIWRWILSRPWNLA